MGFFGCYIYHDCTSTIKHVVAAIGQCPHLDALLVSGDFNIDLVTPEGDHRGEYIAGAIVTTGLEYMSAYFLPYRKSWEWYMGTWCMHLQGR